MRSPLRLAHVLRRHVMRLLRWRTRGVKVMVFDRAGALLLVRHSYGRTDQWLLPGGGVHRGEAPLAAARRELREETDCRLDDLVPSGVFRATTEGRRDTVHLFRATTCDVPVPDGREIVEARFFALDALPAAASPATRRRVAELGGKAAENW